MADCLCSTPGNILVYAQRFTAVVGPCLEGQYVTIEDQAAMRTNWAGNITFHAARHHFPGTLTEVREIVRHADKVWVVGATPFIQ